jgi:hypothetical protein
MPTFEDAPEEHEHEHRTTLKDRIFEGMDSENVSEDTKLIAACLIQLNSTLRRYERKFAEMSDFLLQDAREHGQAPPAPPRQANRRSQRNSGSNQKNRSQR